MPATLLELESASAHEVVLFRVRAASWHEFLFDRAWRSVLPGNDSRIVTTSKVADHRSTFMSDYAKLIFGLRTSEEVTLTVTGQPGPRAPDLQIKTIGQAKDTVIAYGNGAWIATLTAGDHAVWMAASDDSWFDGEVRFTLSSASAIVIHATGTSPQPMAWLASTGAVDDPKNPWPPPVAAEPLSDQAWLSGTLQDLKKGLSLLRMSPDFRSLPRKTAR
jgi:hypothetical protein